MMKTLDLFSGCGGMSLGFQQAGFELVMAFDNWQPVVEVYKANFAHPIYQLDLRESQVMDYLKDVVVDMVIGGPPCQDFSSAGKRDESLGRADLTLRFAELVAEIVPHWFVMENVERIATSYTLQMAKDRLQSAGYALTQTVLNASLCGVPQNRKRFFLIGEWQGRENGLLPFLEKNLAAQPMSLYDYFGDSLGIEYYYRHPRSYQRRAIFSIYEPSPTIRGVNRPIPATYQTHPNDATGMGDHVRPLTTLERSSIQTFPPDFQWGGNKSDLEQMIGNAVPVKLAEYVALAILDYSQTPEHRLPQPLSQLSLF